MEMSEQYLWPKPGNSSWGLWQHHLDLGALIPMAKRTASPRLMGWVGAGPMPCITTCNSHFNIYFRDDVLGGNHPHSVGVSHLAIAFHSSHPMAHTPGYSANYAWAIGRLLPLLSSSETEVCLPKLGPTAGLPPNNLSGLYQSHLKGASLRTCTQWYSDHICCNNSSGS